MSLIIHIGILALLLRAGADRARPKAERGLSVIALTSQRETRAQKPQVAEKLKVDVTPQQGETLFPVELPMVAQEAASSGPDGAACQLAAAIQADLLIDSSARAEIAAIPSDSRSVANAIVLWTGAPEHVRPILPATDLLILKRLETVPAPCLDVDQAGPDFIYASIENRTVSMAIGSGQWRWRQYLDLLLTTVRPTASTVRISPAPEH